MRVISGFFGKPHRAKRRRPSAFGDRGLRPERLEGRALMALISSVAFDPKGQEVALSISNQPDGQDGSLSTVFTPGYVASGPQPVLTSNFYTPVLVLRSASIAYDKAGDAIQDVVDDQGVATQDMSLRDGLASQIVLGRGVESIGVAFEPDGTGVSDVVYEDGSFYEFTSSGGATLVATNVVSASVAIDNSGNKLQDYVTADEVAHEISTPAAPSGGGAAPPPTTTTLGTNVVSSGIAFDGNGGVVRAVVFSDGSDYQYDYAGAHLDPAGPLFSVATQHIQGSTTITFDPTSGEEYATVTFPTTDPAAQPQDGGNTYLYKSSGGESYLSQDLTTSLAFGPKGHLIQHVVTTGGVATEFIDGQTVYSVYGEGMQPISNIFGLGLQSISSAFTPEGDDVDDIVYLDGEYYEFDNPATGTLIASDVVSASVAIDKAGDKLRDYVTADGVAREIRTPAATEADPNPTPTTTTLGTNVVSISVAYDGNGGIARSVLFNDGLAYQYDYAGQHLQGQVFDPLLYNPDRLSLKAGLPSY